MPITRKFLDWTRPALVTAAEFLLARHASSGGANLSSLVLVMPGGRAGRRMLEILVRLCDEQSLVLTPPQIVTAGALPELLYRPKQRFATELEQQFAWIKAIEGHDPSELAKIARRMPEPGDLPAWLDLASLLQKLHRELATDLLSFADVMNKGKQVEGFAEEDRWRILGVIQDCYLRTLDELQLWDKQTARGKAIEKRECETDREIVLMGTVDLNEGVRKMLDQVEDRTPGHVTALIFAPLELTDRFDAHGCVIPEKWADAPLEIPDEVLLTADGAADQAESVVRAIAEYAAKFRADEITVGVPDETLVPQIERTLAQCGLPARWGPGQPLSRGGVYRLLAAFADYLEGRRPADFAALVRHADLTPWLRGQGVRGDWLSELDRYHNEHFPYHLGEEWLGFETASVALRQTHTAIEKLISPLRGKSLPLPSWSPLFVELLAAVYGERLLDVNEAEDRFLLTACKTLNETLCETAELAPKLAPSVTASEALSIALAQVATEAIPPPAEEESIEILGWLELSLDDAPALVVTSFNDGFVPKAENADLFLPNALRVKLNLEHNARRYARDAYMLSVLLASRSELKLVVARRDTEKNPLAPSRLVFASDGETIARRALRFFEPRPAQASRAPLVGAWSAGRESSNLPVPLPTPLAEPLVGMSVTAFKTYLACPYRFYLSRLQRLEALDDAADELDGGAFGGIMHAVLQQFALSDERDSTSAEEIAARLRHELNECVAATFGTRPAAAIAIQAEQMRARLEAFAEKQAEWAAAGWRIEFAEREDTRWEWEVDGKPFILTGRIDRIDVNERTGKRAILDYKTSDSGLEPRRTHQRGDEWIDLQLPLYRYLAQSLGLAGPFVLAYALLPKDTSRTGFALADWDEAELDSADEVAREVVRRVRGQVFWPPGVLPAVFSDEFASICQVGVYQGRPA